MVLYDGVVAENEDVEAMKSFAVLPLPQQTDRGSRAEGHTRSSMKSRTVTAFTARLYSWNRST